MNDQYAELYSSYQWLVPSQFNMAQACLHRWAENSHEGRRTAIYTEDELGHVDSWSYTRLSETSNQLANGLLRMGVQPGDRVGIAMGQRPEAVASYMAIFSVGAVAVPLPGSLESGAIEACLRHAQARVALVDTLSGPDLLQAHMNYPELSQIVGLGFQHDNIIPWRTLLARQPATFKPIPLSASRPALLVYKNPADKPLKGVLISHGALIGSLPGFVASQNWFPNMAGPFWSPADWMSAEGLMSALLPALYFGRPVVAALGRFSGARALEILDRYGVTHAYFPAHQLGQMVSEAELATAPDMQLSLRAVAFNGAGDRNEAMYQWCERHLGVAPNIVLSTPEAPLFIGNSQHKWPAAPGSIGRPYPGHLVTVLDPLGLPCPADIAGELAVNRYDVNGHPDPALFQSYWNDPDATHARFIGDWWLSGVQARVDRHGNFWYMGPCTSAIQSP
ncbi:AMP-binding protein [Pusillimonas noertemannii]|uniref:AMP-binding protein n=1 Tax=Pusillimonas noertemannii TaxID=305977 RepID=UPI000369A434|nr:AMP-binding protein [Pusillimonas noertemannii]